MAVMFILEELNKNNYEALSKLKIKDDQKNFVKDFKGCIEYKKEFPFLRIFGIKKDETYIGLTAFARWEDERIKKEDQWTWFDEFFLDIKYQHLGYGKQIVPIILNKIKEIYNPDKIVLSVRNDNPSAKRLYEELGFKYTNLVYDGETDYIYVKDEFAPDDEIMMFYQIESNK